MRTKPACIEAKAAQRHRNKIGMRYDDDDIVAAVVFLSVGIAFFRVDTEGGGPRQKEEKRDEAKREGRRSGNILNGIYKLPFLLNRAGIPPQPPRGDFFFRGP